MKEQEKQPAQKAPAEDDAKGRSRSSGDKENTRGKPFDSFDLPDDILSSLTAMGISHCTPIQEKVIEPILAGGDIIGKAETGTGKTIGFGAPLVARIETQRVAVQGLVMTPTRELAQQVAEVVEALGKNRNLEVVLLVGGVHASGQIAQLRKGSQVVVGTPGRILDLLKGGTLSLGWCETVVLDEADRMLDMGFIDEVGAILAKIPRERQTLLFSATIPQGMEKLVGRYMRDPKTYSTSKGLATVPDIDQRFITLPVHKKLYALRRILDDNPGETAIIFCNTKRQVIDLDRVLWGNNYSAGSLHGDQTQDIRFGIMDKFRAGDIKVLVATDVASRGLDIPAVARVINYDVPEESESYVHRIGRTGRANMTGIAITLVAPKERRYWEQVLKDTKFKITSLDRQEGRRMGNTSSRGDGPGKQSDGSGNKGDGHGNKGDGSGNKGDGHGNKGDGSGNKGDGSGNKGDGSGNKGDGHGNKPRRQRRRRGRREKDGEKGRDGGGRSGEGRRQGSSESSSRRGEGEGRRSRGGKSSGGGRGRRRGGAKKLPKMDPEFENKEEMDQAIAEFKEQDEEKRKRQQSRPAKLTFDVVDDDYLKKDYFNLDSEVLERADDETDKQKKEEKAERDKRRGGEGGRRRRRRKPRSGGGRGGGGGGGGGERAGGGENAGGEKKSGDGSRRRRRPRRRRGSGGGGSGGGGGGGGGSGGGGGGGGS